MCLVKPQFECGPDIVRRGRGVVRDPADRQSAVDAIVAFARELHRRPDRLLAGIARAGGDEADGGGGYEQGANDPCLFYHPRLKATLATYVDDLAIKAERKNAEEAFAAFHLPYAHVLRSIQRYALKLIIVFPRNH